MCESLSTGQIYRRSTRDHEKDNIAREEVPAGTERLYTPHRAVVVVMNAHGAFTAPDNIKADMDWFPFTSARL